MNILKKKILPHFSKSHLESSKKIAQIASFTSAIMLTGCGIPGKNKDTIESFDQNRDSPSSIMTISEGNKVTQCNYSRINYKGEILKVTAHHCLKKDYNFWLENNSDIVITNNFPRAYKIINNTQKKIRTANKYSYETPKILELSKLKREELLGKPVTIQGCLPNGKSKNEDYCIKIAGEIVNVDDFFKSAIVYIPNNQIDTIEELDEKKDRDGILSGMSGSSVIDENGDFVGVLSFGFKKNISNIPGRLLKNIFFEDIVGVALVYDENNQPRIDPKNIDKKNRSFVQTKK